MTNAVDDFDEIIVMNALRWKKERDEAREVAKLYRDLYALSARVGTGACALPWEAERDSNRNGE